MTIHVSGFPEDLATPKAQARRLVTALRGKTALSHAQALEVIAHVHGMASWGHLRAAIETRPDLQASGPAVPIETPEALRVQSDVQMAEALRALIDANVPAGPDVALYNVLFQEIPAIMSARGMSRADCAIVVEMLAWAYPGLVRTGIVREIRRQDLRAICIKRLLDDPMRYEVSAVMRIEALMAGFDLLHAARRRGPWPTSRDDIEAMTGREIRPEPGADVSAMIDCRHALLYSDDPAAAIAVLQQNHQVFDLRAPDGWSAVAESGHSLPWEGPGHPSGVAGLRLYFGHEVGLRLEKRSDEPQRALHERPRVVVLSLMDALNGGGVDVLLAQARALRFHIMVLVDLQPAAFCVPGPEWSPADISERRELARVMELLQTHTARRICMLAGEAPALLEGQLLPMRPGLIPRVLRDRILGRSGA